jgi:hypothetical protein
MKIISIVLQSIFNTPRLKKMLVAQENAVDGRWKKDHDIMEEVNPICIALTTAYEPIP